MSNKLVWSKKKKLNYKEGANKESKQIMQLHAVPNKLTNIIDLIDKDKNKYNNLNLNI